MVDAANQNGGTQVPIRSVTDEGQLTAGDPIRLTSGAGVQAMEPDPGGSVPAGTEIGIVWRSPSGDRVTLIASHTTA